MNELRDYLATIPPGRLADVKRLTVLLKTCWHHFAGSDETDMAARKLDSRIEEVKWDPPYLTFTIARHGGAVVGGSKRGEVQTWTLDLCEATAVWHRAGYRQLRANQPRIDMKAVAIDLVQAILGGGDDPRIVRQTDGTVQVQIGSVVPKDCGPKETVAGRRSRLRVALKNELGQKGWGEVGGEKWRFAPLGT